MTNEQSLELVKYTGIGRRKTAVARVGIFETTDKMNFFINGQPASHYLCANPTLLSKVCAPLDLLGMNFWRWVSETGTRITILMARDGHPAKARAAPKMDLHFWPPPAQGPAQ